VHAGADGMARITINAAETRRMVAPCPAREHARMVRDRRSPIEREFRSKLLGTMETPFKRIGVLRQEQFDLSPRLDERLRGQFTSQ